MSQYTLGSMKPVSRLQDAPTLKRSEQLGKLSVGL
jgi:hypothetical protein